MTYSLEQAYLEFMRNYGGSVPIGYGGSQAAWGADQIVGNGVWDQTEITEGLVLEGQQVIRSEYGTFILRPNGQILKVRPNGNGADASNWAPVVGMSGTQADTPQNSSGQSQAEMLLERLQDPVFLRQWLNH